MKHHSRAIALLAALVASQASSASLNTLHEKWRNKEYDAVLPQLLVLRGEAGGRSWQVDYMIGTSACLVSPPWPMGRTFLLNVLVYKDLPAGMKDGVQAELARCQGQDRRASSGQSLLELVPISAQALEPGAAVFGKGGYLFEAERAGVANLGAVSPISRSELQQRLVNAGEEAKAMAVASTRLGAGSRGVTQQGIVVVCGPSCAPQLEREVIRCLAPYRQAVARQFEMQPSPRPLTVYIPDEPADIARTARKLHGVVLPPGTVAYSVADDLSIVGPATTQGCGSLAHELVHLDIRGNFGDSPAWLEEGLAAQVAVARLTRDTLQFSWSWRDTILAGSMDRRPSVAALVAMDWAGFTATDASSVRRVATVHAMAASFVRYLDSQRKLVPVFRAIRDRRLVPSSGQSQTDLQILESELGKPANQIDADFAAWFGQQRRTNAAADCRNSNAPARNCQ